eukprot:3546486-Amphidinium_carterae.1
MKQALQLIELRQQGKSVPAIGTSLHRRVEGDARNELADAESAHFDILGIADSAVRHFLESFSIVETMQAVSPHMFSASAKGKNTTCNVM